MKSDQQGHLLLCLVLICNMTFVIEMLITTSNECELVHKSLIYTLPVLHYFK